MILARAPHTWEDGTGRHSADCFPFINGKPCHDIAACAYCKLYREEADYCDGWKNEPENSPVFCGPICERFTMTEGAKEVAEHAATIDKL